MTYAGKAMGQHMQHKATDKPLVAYDHLLQAGIIPIVLPGEGGVVGFHNKQLRINQSYK